MKTKIGMILLAMALMFGAVGCSKVPAGNVGVKVYLLGGEKGVDTQELTPGRYWIGVNEELYLFPTYSQTYTWTRQWVDENQDNAVQQEELADESISFQTVEGLVVSADVGITYEVDPTKVNTLFQKYRKGLPEITDFYLRNMVRDALVTAASTRPIESVYGAGKADLLKEVEKRVREQVAPYGIRLEKLYWAGDFRLPETVVKAINAKIQATQFAAQRANEVAAAKAEADKAIEAARGEAESKLLVAEAEAKSLRLKAEAIASNPRLVELTAIEKWDGKLPHYNGGGLTPFVQIPKQ